MNKKGNSKFEKIIAMIFGIVVIILVLTSGLVAITIQAFSNAFGTLGTLGALFGGLLGLLFIGMIVLSIWEAFNRR